LIRSACVGGLPRVAPAGDPEAKPDRCRADELKQGERPRILTGSSSEAIRAPWLHQSASSRTSGGSSQSVHASRFE
jgi:hypothetical protein